MRTRHGTALLVAGALAAVVGGNAVALAHTPGPERVAVRQAAAVSPGQIRMGYANGPGAVPNTMKGIRSLRLPAGRWAVTAKLFVEGGTYADCQLSDGAVYDVAKAGLYGTSGTITSTLDMTIAIDSASRSTARVSCTDQGGAMNWWYLKITAVSGGSLITKPL